MARDLVDIIADLVVESLDDEEMVRLIEKMNDAVDEETFTYRLGDLFDALRDQMEGDDVAESLLDREDADLT